MTVTAEDRLDTTETTDMTNAFRGCRAFDEIPSLTEWDTSQVSTMHGMLEDARSFDQDLGELDVSSVENISRMLHNVELSTRHFNALLRSWAHQQLQQGVEFDAGDSRYTPYGEPARRQLIEHFHWDITDGGESG